MVLPGVLTGHIRLCLGYTEPEGGSDVATCKTRATRDGDEWIINGSKMFTSNAQNAKYVFLLTNTDPQGAKHKNLTMFLVPLDSPGIEIQGIRTLDGDRTNIVYYSDVRVDDLYRIGEVNGGWTVMRSALDAEHGLTEREDRGLQDVATMASHGVLMAEAVDGVAALVARRGRRVGEVPARTRFRPSGGGAVYPRDVRTRRDRPDDARCLRGSDGLVGACRRVAARYPRALPTMARRNPFTGWHYRWGSMAGLWKCSAT